MKRSFAFLLSLLLLYAAPLRAEPSFAAPGWVSELRGGFLKHDVDIFSPGEPREEEGVDANAELLFTSPGFLKPIGSPRPAIGSTANLAGATSHVYAGLVWDYEFENSFLADFSFGFAVHDGTLDVPNHATNTKKLLGSRILFHPAIDLGYRFDNGYALMFFWEHISNGWVLAGSDAPNFGIDNWGLRLSYRFDRNPGTQ